MTVEEFAKSFNQQYDVLTDSLRIRGDSHAKRQLISKECGYPALPTDPAAQAIALRVKGAWPQSSMLDHNQTTFLMDGEYASDDGFHAPEGYFSAPESPSKTFVFHTSTIYTNVQVSISTCPRVQCHTYLAPQ